MLATRCTVRPSLHAALLTVGIVLVTTATHANTYAVFEAIDTMYQFVEAPTTRSANPSKSVGNSYAGAFVSFPIQVSNENSCRTVKIASKGTVKLLKKSVTAAELEASVKSCSNGTRIGTVKAKLAGFTVAINNSSVSFSWRKNFTKTLISASVSVWVGPVPVTVRGSAAGTLSAKLALSITSSYVGISGPLSVFVKGTASGSVGVPGYNVGLETVLELLKSTLTPAAKAATSSLSGTIKLCFEPLVIKLKLKVSAWPFSWKKNLATYSLAKQCATVLSL